MKLKQKFHQLAIKLGKNPRLAFTRLLQGGLVFLFGNLILIMSDQMMDSSVQQEIIALIGLIIAGAGVILALIGYLSMSILRIYQIINDKD